MSTCHNLKTWPDEFRAVVSGEKSHEVRNNDRLFKVGDFLVLQEFNPVSAHYTGNYVTKVVTYVTRGGTFGLLEGTVVMSISDPPCQDLRNLK